MTIEDKFFVVPSSSFTVERGFHDTEQYQVTIKLTGKRRDRYVPLFGGPRSFCEHMASYMQHAYREWSTTAESLRSNLRIVLPRCQWGVIRASNEVNPEPYEAPCGEPAIAIRGSNLYVCQEHDAEYDRMEQYAAEQATAYTIPEKEATP